MIPTIIRHHEIGNAAYYLIQVIGDGKVENRIQVYTPLDDGRLLYERGECWSKIDAALEQYNQIIRDAEIALM